MKHYFKPSFNRRVRRFRTPGWLDLILLVIMTFLAAHAGWLMVEDKHLFENSPISSPGTQILAKTAPLEQAQHQPKLEEYEITAYCLNTDPMANGERVHNGAIACPAFLPFGTKVIIDSPFLINNEFICKDRMGLKYRNGKYIDIWVGDCDIALDFGRRKIPIEIIPLPINNKE